MTNNWRLDTQITKDEQAALTALLIQDSTIIGGGLTLSNVQSINALLFIAAANLQKLYQLDPFDTTYETNTLALYTRQYAIARAAAVSGPTNVRGGTARQGFELAELDTQQSINQFREIWQNQVKVAGVVIEASNAANAAYDALVKLQLEAQKQQAATEQGRVLQTLSAAEQLSRDKEVFLRQLAWQADTTNQMETDESITGYGLMTGVNTGFGMSTWR